MRKMKLQVRAFVSNVTVIRILGYSPCNHGDNTVNFGYLSLRLQAVQSRELRELPVELLELTVGDSHGLLGERV